VRADAAARVLVDLLPAHPVLTAALAADILHVSERAARAALAELSQRGILEALAVDAVTTGRPRRWWQAKALLDATTTWAAR